MTNNQIPITKQKITWQFGYWLLNIGICLVIVSWLLVISSCTYVPTRRVTETGEVVQVEKPLAVSTVLRFEDVPIPAGFNAIRDQSFIYQDASIRVGLLRYTGRAKTGQVLSFFKSQMSLYNWNLTNVVEFGSTTMNFVKADEACIISIEPLATKSILNIVISPKAGRLDAGFGLGGGRKGKF